MWTLGSSQDPLILTPFVEQGEIELGRMLSRVAQPLPGLQGHEMVRSYSGFFKVNQTVDKNIFFWFFPALVSCQLSLYTETAFRPLLSLETQFMRTSSFSFLGGSSGAKLPF